MNPTTLDSDRWATASLRILSARLTADELNRRLGASLNRLGTSVNKTQEDKCYCMWTMSSTDLSSDLSAHLRELVSVIERNLPTLLELKEQCSIDLFCGFASESGQGGFVLDRLLLARLGAIPFDLIIDLYPPGKMEVGSYDHGKRLAV